MELFSNIRYGIGRWVLRKNLKKLQRTKRVYNLTTARKIGILFDGTREENFDRVLEFYKFLKEKGINTHVLGYVHAKDLPDKYLFKKDFYFILRKNINWYYRPVSEDVEKFVNSNFDILIDLNLVEKFPCQFLIAISHAHFKVGKFTSTEGFYDLMIHIDKGKKIDYFIEQIKHYLEVINRPELSSTLLQ